MKLPWAISRSWASSGRFRASDLLLDSGWLFPGQNPVNPISDRQLSRAILAAATDAQIDKRVTMHLLRHSFATHLPEQKVDIRLIHVLPGGFHRIRHYGLLANARRRDNLKRARKLLLAKIDDGDAIENSAIDSPASETNEIPEPSPATYLCPDCGSPMVIIECFEREQLPRAPPVRIIAS